MYTCEHSLKAYVALSMPRASREAQKVRDTMDVSSVDSVARILLALIVKGHLFEFQEGFRFWFSASSCY